MPRYDYHCPVCDEVFELTQSFDSEPVAECPKCGSRSRRLISHPAIHFKGSGFYTTDNRSSNAAAGPSSTPSEKAGTASGSDSKAAAPSDSTSSSSSSNDD